jgi:serine phosphatase RsbU (regulator of sigma subunit)
MDFLHASMRQGSHQARVELLPATINSMYAAENLAQAVHFLRRGLVAAFGVQDSQLWFRPLHENFLRLIGPTGMLEIGLRNETQIELNADRLETRAYSQQVVLRGQEGERKVIRAIPLMIPGQKPIGVATIIDDIRNESILALRERDQQLVGFLNQAARALQTVNVRRQELALAGKVQASLLPESLPEIPNWQISAYWKPARETSGDFYDFIPLPGEKLGIVIADVVDKGMGAALLMTLTRTLIRTFAMNYPENPDQLLRITNQRILSDLNIGLFVTLFYGILDPKNGILTYANAGQPPPYLFLGNHGPQAVMLTKTGMALGVREEEEWRSETIQMVPGSILFLYTDGVIDTLNQHGEFFGENQLIQILSKHNNGTTTEMKDTVITEIYNFAGLEFQNDDITLMILKRDKTS